LKSQLELTVFEEQAQELIKKYQIPGVAIGIAHNGSPIYEKGFGYRNVDKQLPVTMDTVFGIASVTKSFTCVAIMQLQEAGKLSVHDPVVKYLPEFSTPSDATNKMTIHHFMTHSAGIPPLQSLLYANKRNIDADPSAKDYPGLKFQAVDQEPIDTGEQLMEFIGSLEFELLGEPGTEFSYSNDCYALLGLIVERLSGKPFEQYVKEYILEPAGMVNSCCLIEELEHHDEITSLYAAKKNENGVEIYEAPLWWDSPAMRASGYLKSTINDMLRYAEIFRNNGKVGNVQILSSESVQQMMTPQIECAPGKYYGYGLMITPNYHGATLVEHGGNMKAISSQMATIPERGISAMILTNLAGVPATTIMAGALNVVEDRSFYASAQQLQEVECSELELAEYEGIYTSNEGMSLNVKARDGHLDFTSPGMEIQAKCVGKDLFLASVRDQNELVRFIRNDSGEITRVAYHFRQFPRQKES
jgi:CubicO group peptidase (beta-lactamase class C family)